MISKMCSAYVNPRMILYNIAIKLTTCFMILVAYPNDVD
jgi:hypothetical protein